MNTELVLAEWRRAQEALGSAELLTHEGYHADAIARTYYALFHAAKAALHVNNIAADTHAGVRRMFGLHLIKPGAIESEWAAPLGQSLDERLAADYDPEVLFSKKENSSCLPRGKSVCPPDSRLSAGQRIEPFSFTAEEKRHRLKVLWLNIGRCYSPYIKIKSIHAAASS